MNMIIKLDFFKKIPFDRINFLDINSHPIANKQLSHMYNFFVIW
jgi:hypothetical protein